MNFMLTSYNATELFLYEYLSLLYSYLSQHNSLLFKYVNDFIHQVISEGCGELVLVRRPEEKFRGRYTADMFLPCEFCLGFYLSTSLWVHAAICTFKPEGTQPSKNFTRNARVLLSPFVKQVSEEDIALNTIFDGMKETAANPGLKKICENDLLIREFTLSMVGRLGEDDEQRIKDIDNVRTKVRTVGRLLKQLQHDNQTCDPLSTFICGQRYKKVCEATKRLAVTTDSPQIALVLGNYIKHLALLKISMGICNGDADEQSEGRDFQFLFQAHWNNQVSCVAKRRQRLRKLNKSEKLPDTEDLVKLRTYIEKETADICKVSAPSQEEIIRLQKLTLVRIVLFNKRRISEVQDIKVKDLVESEMNRTLDSEIKKSLDVSEKALATR